VFISQLGVSLHDHDREVIGLFGIYQPEVSEILRELWEWLTWNPRNMKPELVDLVVDALAPQLQRELRARKGWRVGPSGDREKKPGRPPTSRPAWVAAAAIDTHLRAKGVGALDATDRALELAAILTGREMAAPEELRHAHMGNPSPARSYRRSLRPNLSGGWPTML